MAVRFEYLESRAVHEAISLLSRYGCAAKLIAGGTDLLNEIRSKQIAPEYIIDIGAIPGIDSLTYDDHGTLSIGALATLRTLEISPQLKAHHAVISRAAAQIGSIAIRNVGTIGGNLCHASPAADTAPGLLALRAKVKIAGPAGERTVALDDFFAGPGRTVLAHDEMLVEIEVPAMPPHTKAVYLKHAIRGAADLAIVGVAVMASLDDGCCRNVKIALGAVAPTPMRARGAESILEGKMLNDALIENAARAASEECRPITDVRASADYRRQMVKVLTQWAIKRVFAENKQVSNEATAETTTVS
jgi:carbon-monoxide dehydrogenase medium subunit